MTKFSQTHQEKEKNQINKIRNEKGEVTTDSAEMQRIIRGYYEQPYGKKDFLGGSDGKASAYNVGNPGSIPGLGRSPGEENGIPLQYSCLENPMDRGDWQATVHGAAKSQT